MAGAEFSSSSSTSGKIAEIFLTASAAFQKLGELTLQLNMSSATQQNAHWSEKEIELLRSALYKFSTDLDNVADVVRGKTSAQIRIDYKRKALDDDEGKINLGTAIPVKRRNYGAPATKRQPATSVERTKPVPTARPNALIDEGYPDYVASLLSSSSP